MNFICTLAFFNHMCMYIVLNMFNYKLNNRHVTFRSISIIDRIESHLRCLLRRGSAAFSAMLVLLGSMFMVRIAGEL